MPTIAYLYGRGAVESGKRLNDCYLKCVLTQDYRSGLMPSVLHAYVAYAKDIGLEITDIVLEGEAPFEQSFTEQLSYSLWPMLYVNNSRPFVDTQRGVPVWSAQPGDAPEYRVSIALQTSLSIFHRETAEAPPPAPALTRATEVATPPRPSPGTRVRSDRPWFIMLDEPVSDGSPSQQFAYETVAHYNEILVYGTLLAFEGGDEYRGTPAITAQVLEEVIARDTADLPLLPDWPGSPAPAPYEQLRLQANNYNIAAGLFSFAPGEDPSNPNTRFRHLVTAHNIKGEVKIGHAETRLLLALDAINQALRHPDWFEQVMDYYGFAPRLDMRAAGELIGDRKLILISSLKPCYMCAGEFDASESGFVESVNGLAVRTWASFPNSPPTAFTSHLAYFDVDANIDYLADIHTRWQGAHEFDTRLQLLPWAEWSALVPEGAYAQPMGARLTYDAGRDLKDPTATARYRNSAHLMRIGASAFNREYAQLVHGYANEEASDERDPH